MQLQMGIVAGSCNTSTLEAEAGGLWDQDQPEQGSEILSHKNKNKHF